MAEIVKTEVSENFVIITVKINGKEITHEILVNDPCIGCPCFIGQCPCNCDKIG